MTLRLGARLMSTCRPPLFHPSVISVDLMNETLNSRIYDYFKEHHDARECPYQEQHQRNHKPHLHSALAKVGRKKNELKKKFR